MARRAWTLLPAWLAIAVPAAAANTSIAAIDLQAPFQTPLPWRFVATQGPTQENPATGNEAPGPIRLCISADDGQTCTPDLSKLLTVPGASDLFDTPHALLAARIVWADDRHPLLLLETASLRSGDGDQRRATALLRFNGVNFEPVYENRVDSNNNQEIRFIEAGKLRGAVISSEPTTDAPFAFWITVSRLSGNRYAPVLRYRSLTRYGDGNDLPVIDSEMPEIERRLGLRAPGSALPLPSAGCAEPHLVRGALWCHATR